MTDNGQPETEARRPTSVSLTDSEKRKFDELARARHWSRSTLLAVWIHEAYQREIKTAGAKR